MNFTASYPTGKKLMVLKAQQHYRRKKSLALLSCLVWASNKLETFAKRACLWRDESGMRPGQNHHQDHCLQRTTFWQSHSDLILPLGVHYYYWGSVNVTLEGPGLSSPLISAVKNPDNISSCLLLFLALTVSASLYSVSVQWNLV